jgi:hypothetical protein
MSSEREADRALKRQVDPVTLPYLSPNMPTVYELAWHSSRLQRKRWERKRLTVRSLPQMPHTNGLSLTLLTDSKVVNAFHSAMALLGNI